MEAAGRVPAARTEGALGEAYVSGALSALAEGSLGRLFYELLAEILSVCGYRPYLPHRHSDPVGAPSLGPHEVFEIDRDRVSRAALVVAYAGVPSFGVGIEVEIAREQGLPVILVVEQDRPVSRILLGNPAVREVVRYADLESLRRSLAEAVGRVVGARAAARPASDERVVQRFLRTLADARRLPESEVSALLRLGGVEGELGEAVRAAIASDRLFAAGLRDLVGRHSLRGEELGAFLSRYVLGRSVPPTARRRLAAALARLGLAANDDVVAQWLVTELITPPTRALQLRLFAPGGDRE